MALNETLQLQDVIERLHERFGKDFSSYRLSCLERRLALRISTLGLRGPDEYLDYLNDNPDEIERLLDTVTIHVTEFFRDREVYDSLARDILPRIVARRLGAPSKVMRAWSAGCSTGEEAYSVAITLLRYVEMAGIDLGVEVFGTDVSRLACRTARRGVYPGKRIEDVPPIVKDRYFEPAGDEFRVTADVRRVVKFAVHDLFASPPYSLLDLIVCRNVLIHFDHAVRDDILAKFHAALDDGSILILGKSEAVMGRAADLFTLVDPRNKMYRKKALRAPEGGRS
jgi:two-component system CheB/CheR fusion protein